MTTKRPDVNPEEGKKKYGDVEYADERNKKYPIDTPTHVRAALSYFGRARNRNEYSKADQRRIDARIHAAAKKFKIGPAANDSLNLSDLSSRSVDDYGRMRVTDNVISKAIVSPYLGSELDSDGGLGLDPDKEYQVLRDPGELAKAADTFNNLPLLDLHTPVSAEDPQRERQVGCTGTDAVFKDGVLTNSLAIWDGAAIEGINSREQVELSCGYGFDLDLSPGIFEGKPYDMVMRNIKGNHVALVDTARVPGAVVADQQPKEGNMKNAKLSPRAVAIKGALTAHLVPRLAADKRLKVGELNKLATDAASTKKATRSAFVGDGLKRQFASRLAKDASLDLEDIPDLMEMLEEDDDDDAMDTRRGKDDDADRKGRDRKAHDDDEGEDDDEDAGGALMKHLEKAGLSEDDLNTAAELMGKMGKADKSGKDDDAYDEDGEDSVRNLNEDEDGEDDDRKGKDRKAHDRRSIQMATDAAVRRVNAMHIALDEVKPLVGAIAPMADAASVYRLALDAMEVDHKGIRESRALKALVKQQLALKAHDAAIPAPAMDSGKHADFLACFPNATK